MAGEGNEGGGGGGWESPIFTEFWNPLLIEWPGRVGEGLFLQCPLANTLIVSIQKVELHAMCMFLCFFNLSRLFFILDRFGQQADGYIAPGFMLFMFLSIQGLPM